MRFAAYFAALILCLGVLLASRGQFISGLLEGIAAGLVVLLLDEGVKDARYAKALFDTIRFWRTRIRVSVSYLYRIKVDGLYLLVRGSRIPDQFQPVGGVWKILPEGRAFLSSIGAVDDRLVPIDQISADDLRVRIDGRHLLAFIRWFDTRAGRETDPWREFYEELIRPGILPAASFGWITYRYVRRHTNPILFSPRVQSRECLIADIYELIPTPEQEAILRALAALGSSLAIIWADEEQIVRLGVERTAPIRTKISQSASWTV